MKSIAATLSNAGVEPDQRLALAISHLPLLAGIGDHLLFLELLRLNSTACHRFDFDSFWSIGKQLTPPTTSSFEPVPEKNFQRLLEVALEHRRETHTLGTRDFLRALRAELRKGWGDRPWTGLLLGYRYGGYFAAEVWDTPEVLSLFRDLENIDHGSDDFGYLVTLQEVRLVFRITSVLGDYLETADHVLRPRRAVLTHFRDCFGAFTAAEIAELESLLNNPKARERAFQDFFERHPRERFGGAIQEARAQLLKYRDWFREPANRNRLRGNVDMEIYEPQLAVVIGRSRDFRDAVDRQRLRANLPDVEVVTYDDLVPSQRGRLVSIEG
jgi:hypothetical protein